MWSRQHSTNLRVVPIEISEEVVGTSQTQEQFLDVVTAYLARDVVWKILLSLVNACRHLHGSQIFHGEIRVENVLIDEGLRIKLVEKTLLDSTNWVVEWGKETVTLIRGKGVLFSPCILRCLYHQRTQITAYDPFKGDVYAVGMILLECASLRSAVDFYDYDKFKVRST